MFAGGGLRGICPKLNLFAPNSLSSSGFSSLWEVKRLSVNPPAEPVPATVPVVLPPNKELTLVCPKSFPPVEGAAAPKPPPLLAVEEKLNPEAEPPNPEVDGALVTSATGAANEKPAAEGADEAEKEPKPDGGGVATAAATPNPVGSAWVADEPNSALGTAKLKPLALLGWGWAGAPKPVE